MFIQYEIIYLELILMFFFGNSIFGYMYIFLVIFKLLSMRNQLYYYLRKVYDKISQVIYEDIIQFMTV